MLSYAGRLQLIKSVMFAIMNNWMQVFPFPKGVLQKIESICRNFLWTGGYEGSRKAPVAWKDVCKLKSNGGLDIIDIEIWNKANLIRLLWNLSGKSDSLWVRWIQAYYMKNKHLMEIEVKAGYTWIMKEILDQREDVKCREEWDDISKLEKFNMKKMYTILQDYESRVD